MLWSGSQPLAKAYNKKAEKLKRLVEQYKPGHTKYRVSTSACLPVDNIKHILAGCGSIKGRECFSFIFEIAILFNGLAWW